MNKRAIASLALGFASFCLLFVPAIPVIIGVLAILLGVRALWQIHRRAGRERGTAFAVFGILTGLFGLLIGSLLLVVPNVVQDRWSRNSGCVRNLREIGQALRRYHEHNQHFPPPAIVGNQGQPLLSWRVDLLREIDPALYARFHLDEPWDSPHNIKLLPEMPKMYGCPVDAAKRPGMTHFLAVVGPRDAGPHTAFEAGRGVSIDEFRDGPSATLLVGEAARSVPWTMPIDLEFQPAPWMPPPNNDRRDFDREGTFPQFSVRHSRTFNVLRADGSAGPFRAGDRAKSLSALLTRDGMENVGGQ
jgi:hypothetical protein